MDIIFNISVLFLSGLLFARIFGKFKFPDVTGYLIGGIIIGPCVLGLLSKEAVDSMDAISQLALSFIAFSVGSEMNFESIKQMGTKILIVTFFEAIGALIFVTLTMLLFFKTDVAFAITIGSIASATAPAATLMVIKQYNAKGGLVDVLIPVVALDDAICIMAFGVCSSIAITIMSGSDLNFVNMIFEPVKEIFLALIVGFVAGIIFILLSKRLKNDTETLTFTLAMIFIVTTVTDKWGLSSLLTLMMSGIVISNMGSVDRRYQELISTITPPIFIAFFVLSGADLNLGGLKAAGLIGFAYVIARVLGKFFGAMASTKLTGFSKEVQNNLGLTLVPQAGVAIGLSLIAEKIIPEPHGSMIRTIILAGTICYELIGPIVAKIALKRAGCIDGDI